MRLVLTEPRLLKESISIISELVNEARLNITSDFLELKAMDPANVAMVMFKLFRPAFAEYELGQEKEVPINLSELKQVLKRSKPDDLLVLEFAENKLLVSFKGRALRRFYLPIMHLEEQKIPIPKLEFSAKIRLPSAALSDAIDDVSIIGESVLFELGDAGFCLKAQSKTSRASIDFGEQAKVESGSGVAAHYSIEYLKKMVSAAKLAPEVVVQLGKDYPLRLDYSIIDKLHLAFILAPRTGD